MKRKDNRGLTLVELMVSIAILAIIVLPLLSAFVVGVKTNVKAKTKHKATELSQNIMENIEACTLSDIAKQFNYPDAGFEFAQVASNDDVCEIVPVSGVAGGVTYTEANDSNRSSNKINATQYTFRENLNHKYYFFIKNANVNGKTFSAMITLDGTVGKNNTYNTSDKLSSMQVVDTTIDAVSCDSKSADAIVNELDHWGYNGVSQSDITRTIKIDVKKDSITGDTKVVASYSYKFAYEGSSVTFPEAGASYADQYTSVIFDNSSDHSATLRDVYLFYQPWYTSNNPSGGTYGCTDRIEFNNPNHYAGDFHIVKQVNNTIADLEGAEDAYRVAVIVNELNSSKSSFSISTNLNTNLKDPTKHPNQAVYKFNSNENPVTVRNNIKIEELNKSVAMDRIMDVKIDIYDRGVTYANIDSSEPVLSFTGSMVN